MKEVIFLHIGQAGAEIGSSCWDLFCLEHGIDREGIHTPVGDARDSSCEAVFTESSSGQYSPRAVFVDLEPSVLEKIATRNNIFKKDKFVSGKEDAASNYWRGFFEMSNISDRVQDTIRLSAEECDSFQGFILSYSISGGTGSSATAYLMTELNNEYKKVTNVGFSLFPSPKLSTAVVEPYNAVFATADLLDYMSAVFVIDNEALYNVCSDGLEIESPTYSDINKVISQVVSSVTASLRFNGDLNANLSDFQTNLVPYPRIHFLLPSFTPFVSTTQTPNTVNDLTTTVYLPCSQLCTAEHSTGLYMASCLIYRGDVVPKDINCAIAKIKNDKSVRFVDWSPTGFKIGINPEVPITVSGTRLVRTVCKLDNTTAVRQVWDRINRKVGFLTMYT